MIAITGAKRKPHGFPSRALRFGLLFGPLHHCRGSVLYRFRSGSPPAVECRETVNCGSEHVAVGGVGEDLPDAAAAGVNGRCCSATRV